MKAIAQQRYGSADVLSLQDVEPPTVGPDEVLVHVHAAGVDPGVWICMTGRPYLARLAFGLRRPKVAVRGRDVAGVVSAVGERVSQFRPGDEVYGTSLRGSYAEFAVAPAERLAHKPATISFAQAAAVPVSGQTALAAVRAGEVTEGQRVMVIGAGGGVGAYLVQLVKARGAHVTAVCSTAKIDLVRSLGADDAVDYTVDGLGTGIRKYDVIIDTGGDRRLSVLRRMLTPRGTLVLVGGGYDQSRILGGYSRQLLRAPLLSLFIGQRLRGVTARERTADLDELRELIESGKLTPVVERTYPLATAPDAIRRLTTARPAGKLVVTVRA